MGQVVIRGLKCQKQKENPLKWLISQVASGCDSGWGCQVVFLKGRCLRAENRFWWGKLQPFVADCIEIQVILCEKEG